MAHALLPTSFPLIPENGSISARVDILLRIAGFWKRKSAVLSLTHRLQEWRIADVH